MNEHEEYKEMLAAHALSALDGAEARALDTHLRTCAECRAELDSLREASAQLAYATPAIEPPTELRSRILSSIRLEEDSRSLEREGERKAAGAETRSLESNVLSFDRAGRRSWGMAFKVGAVAASVAFVALILALILLWNRYNAVRQEVARLSDRFDQTEGELKRERQALEHERETREIISAPDARIMTLAGTEMAETAHAKFVFDLRTGRAMLMADNLPPAPEGRAYQLWYIAEGKPPMPGHVFKPDSSGHAEMRDELPAEARSATIFAVTLEPSTGMPAPTGPKYLLSAS